MLRELTLDGIRHDADLVVRNAEQLDQLATRELRNGDHPPCRLQDARHDARAVLARPPVERFRMPEDREVVHRHDERHPWP